MRPDTSRNPRLLGWYVTFASVIAATVAGNVKAAGPNDASSFIPACRPAVQADSTAPGHQYRCGRALHRRQNYPAAMNWYRKAADQGHAWAQNDIGILYRDGLGVPQNHAEAMKWFRKAADQSHSAAIYNVGFMYETGRGVTRDTTEALRWYRKASGQGNKMAQASVKRLAPPSAASKSASGETGLEPLANFFGAILAIGIMEREARQERLEGMLKDGKWKAHYWCETDFYHSHPTDKPTLCYERNGAVREMYGLFNRCVGVEGWCNP